MNLAIAYGYQNHMIIRKSYQDGIEFVEGEKLQETNLKEMMVSWVTILPMAIPMNWHPGAVSRL